MKARKELYKSSASGALFDVQATKIAEFNVSC